MREGAEKPGSGKPSEWLLSEDSGQAKIEQPDREHPALEGLKADFERWKESEAAYFKKEFEEWLASKLEKLLVSFFRYWVFPKLKVGSEEWKALVSAPIDHTLSLEAKTSEWLASKLEGLETDFGGWLGQESKRVEGRFRDWAVNEFQKWMYEQKVRLKAEFENWKKTEFEKWKFEKSVELRERMKELKEGRVEGEVPSFRTMVVTARKIEDLGLVHLGKHRAKRIKAVDGHCEFETGP